MINKTALQRAYDLLIGPPPKEPEVREIPSPGLNITGESSHCSRVWAVRVDPNGPTPRFTPEHGLPKPYDSYPHDHVNRPGFTLCATQFVPLASDERRGEWLLYVYYDYVSNTERDAAIEARQKLRKKFAAKLAQARSVPNPVDQTGA